MAWHCRARIGMQRVCLQQPDLPPTILDLLGLDPTKIVHSRSFLQLLKGQQVSDWRNCVVSTYNGQQFGLYTQRMLRTREWKYVWNTTDVDELYDLRNDPDELVNRIHDPLCADVVAELRRRLFTSSKPLTMDLSKILGCSVSCSTTGSFRDSPGSCHSSGPDFDYNRLKTDGCFGASNGAVVVEACTGAISIR